MDLSQTLLVLALHQSNQRLGESVLLAGQNGHEIVDTSSSPERRRFYRPVRLSICSDMRSVPRSIPGLAAHVVAVGVAGAAVVAIPNRRCCREAHCYRGYCRAADSRRCSWGHGRRNHGWITVAIRRAVAVRIAIASAVVAIALKPSMLLKRVVMEPTGRPFRSQTKTGVITRAAGSSILLNIVVILSFESRRPPARARRGSRHVPGRSSSEDQRPVAASGCENEVRR